MRFLALSFALLLTAPSASAQIWGGAVVPTIIDISPVTITYTDEHGEQQRAAKRYDDNAGMYIYTVPKGRRILIVYGMNSSDAIECRLKFGDGHYGWMTLMPLVWWRQWFTNHQKFEFELDAVDSDESGSITASVEVVDGAGEGSVVHTTPTFSIQFSSP
jgi:hypothetical protein